MKIISLVSDPAIQVNWVKFNNRPIKLSVIDAEQRIILGPALIPDLPIKRQILEEVFYISIDAPNILQTAIKFQQDGIANRLDINHDQALLQGVTVFESFVTNKNRVQQVKGYEDLPEGTWFLTSKVNNDEVWQRIQSGELQGYSIDALFKFEKAESLDTSTVEHTIKEILNTL